MDWIKYKDSALIHIIFDKFENIPNDLKEKIINYNGLFPDVLTLPIYLDVPERKDFEEKHPILRDGQVCRAVRYRHMSEGR